jgi:hypothetical protein
MQTFDVPDGDLPTMKPSSQSAKQWLRSQQLGRTIEQIPQATGEEWVEAADRLGKQVCCSLGTFSIGPLEVKNGVHTHRSNRKTAVLCLVFVT